MRGPKPLPGQAGGPEPDRLRNGVAFERTATTEASGIGRYTIRKRLRGDDLGDKYEALDPARGREHLLRVVAEDWADIGPGARGARRLLGLQHRNVLGVVEVGEAPSLFLVYEWPGPSLSDRLAQAPSPELTWRLRVVLSCCDGLAFAHASGLVDARLSPHDCYVSDSGETRIDITRTVLGPRPALPWVPIMAPEEAMGRSGAGPAVDVFAAGCLFYEVLTGVRPFQGKTLHAVLYRIISEHPESPRSLNPGIPELVEQWLVTALDKDPGRRFADGEALRNGLRNALAADLVERPSAEGTFYRLTWEEAGGPRGYEFGTGEIRIGRAPELEVSIGDLGLSRHHAKIVADSSGATLYDTRSKGGSQINGCAVVEARLHDGDVLRLGRVTMRFESKAQAISRTTRKP